MSATNSGGVGQAEELRILGAIFWERRSWIAATALLFSIAFGTAAFVITPAYEVNVVLAPVNVERNLSSLASTLNQLGGLASLIGVGAAPGDSRTQEALAVLKSRQFIERYIYERNLAPKLFPRQWDTAAGRWRGPKSEWPTPAKAYAYFDRYVRQVTQDKKTGLVTLTVTWRDRTEAADWANELVQRLNAEMRSRAIAQATASINYLTDELKRTNVVQTSEAMNRLIEAQVNQRMVATVTEDFAFRVVDPAVPPDPDDVVRPKKALLFVAGPLVGLAFGLFLVFVARKLTHPSR